MTTKYYLIQFNDLAFERQEEIVDSVKEVLFEQYQDEATNGVYGKNFGREEYKDMSWQEAVCREYSIDFILWETEEEAKKFDWNYSVEAYAEDEARKKCVASYVEWDIEI